MNRFPQKLPAGYGKLITYELLALFKVVPKDELKPIIKRTATAIFERGGLIRKLQYLGIQNTPYKISAHENVHRQANYLLYEFHLPPMYVEELKEELTRDVDIIRQRVFKKNEPINFECTLYEEHLPAPYRKDVQELLELSKKKRRKKKVEFSSGLGYYPFQK